MYCWHRNITLPHLLTAKQLFFNQLRCCTESILLAYSRSQTSWALSAHYGPIAVNWSIQLNLHVNIIRICLLLYLINRIFVVPVISIKLWCVQLIYKYLHILLNNWIGRLKKRTCVNLLQILGKWNKLSVIYTY